MATLNCVTSTSVPYWNGGRILFEIIDGHGSIPCAISRMALEEISAKNCLGKADFRACFASAIFRPAMGREACIEAIDQHARFACSSDPTEPGRWL